MKRTLFVVAVLVAFGFATGASAATLTVVSDKTTYNVGETITLTVTGDDAGTSAYGIFGQLNYNGALVNNGTRVQVDADGATANWQKGPLQQADTNAPGSGTFSFAFNQVAGLATDSAVWPGTVSTITLIAQAAGTVNVSWESNQPSGFGLDFFGLTDAPGTTFTIIPEPTTVALLGLGLIGLTLGGRRRQD